MMVPAFDPGALLARTYALPSGLRVALRLARVRDLDAIEDLFAREGHGLSRLELARMLRAHPRERIVLCATALVSGTEAVVGFGSVGLHRPDVAPTLVVTDSDHAPGLGSLLGEALLGRAEALSRTRAA